MLFRSGPGGLYTVLAKRQLYGNVGIDGLPGPTETLVIADESADPQLAAADLLAQAEHDILASAILLTPSRRLAEQVQAAVAAQLEELERDAIAAELVRHKGNRTEEASALGISRSTIHRKIEEYGIDLENLLDNAMPLAS